MLGNPDVEEAVVEIGGLGMGRDQKPNPFDFEAFSSLPYAFLNPEPRAIEYRQERQQKLGEASASAHERARGY